MSSIKYLLKDFKLPGGVVFEQEEVKPDYGRFVAKPFEKGFAVTIGNSLRRALLSSIPGCAIVAAKIEGAAHEFSTMPGIIEDVTDILINLKKVRIKLADSVDKKVIHIEKKGPGEFMAGDLNVDSDVKILNPDFYIAALNKTGSINMDLQIERGRGYIPSEELKDRVESNEVGIILIDAIFTPVIKVNYKVENIRVGQRIDFEKLVFQVWTDGTIKPDDAVAFAAKILKDHFSMFLNFVDNEELIVEEVKPKEEEPDQELIQKILNTPVEELELSVRASNCLNQSKIKTIGQLIKITEDEMMNMKNFGKKSSDELKVKLVQYGLWMGMSDEDLKNVKIKKGDYLNETP